HRNHCDLYSFPTRRSSDLEAFVKLTKGRLVEGYGLTEAGPVTHANPINGKVKIGSIGIPLPSTEAKIIDLSDAHSVEVGEIGERSEEHTSELQSLRHLVCR